MLLSYRVLEKYVRCQLTSWTCNTPELAGVLGGSSSPPSGPSEKKSRPEKTPEQPSAQISAGRAGGTMLAFTDEP